MKSYCPHCRTKLRLWQLRCRYCRQAGMSWLHVVVIGVCSVPVIFYLLKSL